MEETVVLVFTTFPDSTGARQIGTEIITRHLAGCVNLVPAAESIYLWQGNLCRENEVVAIFKTTRNFVAAFQAALVELHPYACPEMIVVDAVAGLPAYLKWIVDAVAPARDDSGAG